MEASSYVLEFEKPLRELTKQLEELRQQSIETNVDLAREIHGIEKKIDATQREIYSALTPWQKVQVARHPKRPYALDYVGLICTDFQELHGDRQFNDDRALVGGTAFFKGEAVMIIAQQKGRDTKEKISRNFGMPQPEGYRKALRLMKLAEKFGLPVLTFIDTPGAFPGIESEARHVRASSGKSGMHTMEATLPRQRPPPWKQDDAVSSRSSHRPGCSQVLPQEA